MMRMVVAASLVLVLVGAVAMAGDGVFASGECARCHETQAALAADAGGHAPLVDCVSCHEDRRPNQYGRGHRTFPTSCTNHHDVGAGAHPTPDSPLGPARLRKNCLKCHDPHGSPNAHLVRTQIRAHKRMHSIDFHGAGGAVSGGFVDPESPGKGLCEVCHRTTDFYLANGKGQPHYTEACTICHDHTNGFRPVVTASNCVVCHADEASRLAKTSLHKEQFAGDCVTCHTEANAQPGPGHRNRPACTDCHSPAEIGTHAPADIAALACTQCHDPHGSDNITLVRDVIATPTAGDRPVTFTNRLGKVDDSFASLTAPGTGVCEVCHTSTQFYRADGTGAPHFSLPCFPCHTHEAGFAAP